jgi:hypothetical protein
MHGLGREMRHWNNGKFRSMYEGIYQDGNKIGFGKYFNAEVTNIG